MGISGGRQQEGDITTGRSTLQPGGLYCNQQFQPAENCVSTTGGSHYLALFETTFMSMLFGVSIIRKLLLWAGAIRKAWARGRSQGLGVMALVMDW